ncbi:MAG: nuclear transport factor 2 family protein [Gammaproteobacteria bacterium]|nr:nuclear transport factor 2 family protein [Gammaproteobacteria bacterium]
MAYTLEQLSDIECIRDATKRYCRGVDRLDEDLMKSAYWPDATDDHGVFVGNAMEFSEMCMVGHLRWRSTNHCIFNHSIELDPDGTHARGEAYNVTFLFQKDAEVLDTWYGRYLDVYEKRGDEWRILERVCVHEGTTTGPVDKMGIDAPSFRQGSFDRPSAGRPVGP